MKKQEANQENIDNLVDTINSNYDIYASKALFFPYLISLNLKNGVLTIDTSKSSKFKLLNDKLVFTRYSGEDESINLKEYRKL